MFAFILGIHAATVFKNQRFLHPGNAVTLLLILCRALKPGDEQNGGICFRNSILNTFTLASDAALQCPEQWPGQSGVPVPASGSLEYVRRWQILPGLRTGRLSSDNSGSFRFHFPDRSATFPWRFQTCGPVWAARWACRPDSRFVWR